MSKGERNNKYQDVVGRLNSLYKYHFAFYFPRNPSQDFRLLKLPQALHADLVAFLGILIIQGGEGGLKAIEISVMDT